jgi:hypothetical protein
MPLSRINSASIANSAISAADIADGTITAAKIISVANTQITGNIVSSQITSVANTQITGNIISSQITSVANTQLTGTLIASQIANASITNAKLVNGYPDQDIVTPLNFSYQTFGTGNTFYYLGSPLAIPSAGVWRVFVNLRWGMPSVAAFLRISLGTTSSSSSIFTNARMGTESMQGVSTMNINQGAEWIITCGTGISYPFNLTAFAFQGNNNGSFFLSTDGNGTNAFGAVKLASTTSTGSTPVQLGS